MKLPLNLTKFSEWNGPKSPCFNWSDIQKKSAVTLAKPAWKTWSAILEMFPLLSTGRWKEKKKQKKKIQ